MSRNTALKAEKSRTACHTASGRILAGQNSIDSTANGKDNLKVEGISQQNKVARNNKLNDLTAKEWLPETISVWTQRGLGKDHADAQIERLHPAPFSFTDVSRLVSFFTKQGQTVLDPFVGVGST